MASRSANTRWSRSKRRPRGGFSCAPGIHSGSGSSSWPNGEIAMVFLNGKFMPIEEARVPVLDRGFIFGDGIYELVPVYSRVPFRMDEHLARLERSLAAVRIRNPYSREEWREIILQLVAKQPFEGQGDYFQVTRGVAKRDHSFPKDSTPTVFIMSNPLVNPPQELVERGAAAITAVDDRWD